MLMDYKYHKNYVYRTRGWEGLEKTILTQCTIFSYIKKIEYGLSVTMKGSSIVSPEGEQVQTWSPDGSQVHQRHFYEGDGDWLLSISAKDLTGSSGPRDGVQLIIKKNRFNLRLTRYRNDCWQGWRVHSWSSLAENKQVSPECLNYACLEEPAQWSLIANSRLIVRK